MMRWQDIQDEEEKYAAYLCSREWNEKKEAVHARAYGKCERCFVNKIGAVHHQSYKRKYDELLEDLQANCNDCHAFTHGKSDVDPCNLSLPPKFRQGSDSKSLLCCPRCDSSDIDLWQQHSYLSRLDNNLCVKLFFRCDCGLSFQMLITQDVDGLKLQTRFFTIERQDA